MVDEGEVRKHIRLLLKPSVRSNLFPNPPLSRNPLRRRGPRGEWDGWLVEEAFSASKSRIVGTIVVVFPDGW